jgi:hypothetical protein
MNPSGYDDSDVYDPSDEGELARLRQGKRGLVEEEEDLDGYERNLAADIGLDTEFFRAS